MKIWRFLSLAFCSAILLLPSAVYAESYSYSDAHLHYVNYSQEGQTIEDLIDAMDNANIRHTMVSGLPLVKKWAAGAAEKPNTVLSDEANVYWYSLTDEIVARAIIDLPRKHRERLHPFICGFNPTDQNAVKQVERLLKWYPDLWEGIGEILTRHDRLSGITYGEPARANHPALMAIYELAAKHDLPVMVHSNITSMTAKEPIYLGELEEALKQNPNTRFIWAHAGTSKSINLHNKPDYLASEVERLVATYPNLWVDLSWTVMDEYIYPQGKIDETWLNLIAKHADRFMLGSDMTGKFKNQGKKMRGFDPLLSRLEPAQARKIASENFLDVLPKRVRDRLR